MARMTISTKAVRLSKYVCVEYWRAVFGLANDVDHHITTLPVMPSIPS
jgi:hypothetical protein